MTVLTSQGFILRPWQPGDEPALEKYANNREIRRNLMNAFPHPYTLEEAGQWIMRCRQDNKDDTHFAVV